jgi:ketosteroid isomerase-like protein
VTAAPGDRLAPRQLAEAYLDALARADLAAMLALFGEDFDWRLPSGRPAPFDVVDVLELSADSRVAALHIVYDTADVRPAFEQDTGKPSWPGDRRGDPAGGGQP